MSLHSWHKVLRARVVQCEPPSLCCQESKNIHTECWMCDLVSWALRLGCRHFVRWANSLEFQVTVTDLQQISPPFGGWRPMWACYPMGGGLHVHVYVRSLYNICEGHSAGIASCANEARQSWWMGVPTGTPVLTWT